MISIKSIAGGMASLAVAAMLMLAALEPVPMAPPALSPTGNIEFRA